MITHELDFARFQTLFFIQFISFTQPERGKTCTNSSNDFLIFHRL